MKNRELHLLIAEDETAHVEAIRRAFDRAGDTADIAVAGTLREYRDQIIAQPPDFALVDLNLPDGRATEVLTHPAADAPFPILIMTAFGSESIVVEVMKAGALDYVVKSPESFAAIPHTVERALREWQLLQQNKQAEAAMIASEKRYRRLFEAAKDGLLILNAQTGRVVDANPFLLELLGYSREALVGQHLWNLVVFKDIAPNKTSFDALQAQGHVRYEDLPLETADGRRIEVEFVSNVYWVEHHRVMQCNMRDITERKRAEEKLRESEWRFRDLLENIPSVAVQSYGYDGTTHYWNHASEKLYGYTAEEASGKNLLDLIIPPAMVPGVRQAIQQMAETGQPIPASELTLRRKDGSRVVVFSSHAIVQPPGRPPELFCIDIDLTERKRIEESHARLAMAVGHAAEPIVITDEHGVIIYTNPAFEQTTGYTSAEALGQNPRLLKSGKQDADFYRRMWATLAAGKVWSGNIINKRKDGSLYEEDANISPVLDAAGKIVNYVAVNRDVTEQKKLEAQLLRAQRLESIGTLAGGIAHDLNNALAPIMLSAELLRMEYPKTASSYLGLIQASAQRGADMVKQLLTFAKGAEGERLPVQPKHLFKEMEKLIKCSFPKNLKLQVQCAPELGTVLGDATQLHQVLLNLCVNARDAMPAGGTLSLAARNMEFDATDPRTGIGDQPGRYVEWRVTDTGTGIPPELLDRIFDPFFTTKGPEKGTGLGLSTTLGIVKSHGGFIYVDSHPGQGSTFTVWLPAYCAGQGDTTLLAKTETTFRGQGELILVVDDEEAVRKIVRAALTRMNFKVLTAADGTAALVHVAEHRTDLRAVITDLHMPHMDGLSFVRILKGRLPQAGVIVMSGRMDDPELAGFQKMGLKVVLEKPFTQDKLVAALNAIFPN